MPDSLGIMTSRRTASYRPDWTADRVSSPLISECISMPAPAKYAASMAPRSASSSTRRIRTIRLQFIVRSWTRGGVHSRNKLGTPLQRGVVDGLPHRQVEHDCQAAIVVIACLDASFVSAGRGSGNGQPEAGA